jgi:2-pyrone-4,6-dicarboxylate lactonase
MPIQLQKMDVADLKPPKLVAPPGTVDSHFHVFGPKIRYPYLATRTFTPPDASEEEYTHVSNLLGISRAVLVQPSGYGIDNQRQLDAIGRLKFPTRMVAAVADDVDDGQLHRLHERGVRGVRVVTIQQGGLTLQGIERLAERIVSMGWHLEFLFTPDVLFELHDRLTRLNCDFVIGNLAGIRATSPDRDKALDALQSLLETGRLWMKLFGAYRMSAMPPPHADTMESIRKLIEKRPDRFVWGTDWPHVMLEGDLPYTADTLDILLDWVPDETIREHILVRNPERLYDFEPWALTA